MEAAQLTRADNGWALLETGPINSARRAQRFE
jgi:hypothetical protein